MMQAAERPPHDEVIFVGRSNVGKSTIMRGLTGSDRFQTGRKPGVTRGPAHYTHPQHDFMFTDLPGFGFLSGVAHEQQEAILTALVGYLESHADAILAAVLVLDANAAVEIIDRHADRGDLPHTIELYEFLNDLGVFVILAINKCDKLKDRDARVDTIADRFGLPPPWQQWQDQIAPIAAAHGDLGALRGALDDRFVALRREPLRQYV
jgi:Predicted GTPase